jgi:hypothetical protein
VWLERNHLCFNVGIVPKNIKVLGMQILRLVQFWCKSLDDTLLFTVKYILLQNVQILHLQVGNSKMAQTLDPLFGIENEVLQ